MEVPTPATPPMAWSKNRLCTLLLVPSVSATEFCAVLPPEIRTFPCSSKRIFSASKHSLSESLSTAMEAFMPPEKSEMVISCGNLHGLQSDMKIVVHGVRGVRSVSKSVLNIRAGLAVQCDRQTQKDRGRGVACARCSDGPRRYLCRRCNRLHHAVHIGIGNRESA